MHFVYILFSKEENKFYIGYTQDLERRNREHETGRNHTTSRYKSLQPIFHEAFGHKEDALRRERYFKTTKGRRALRFILRETLDALTKNLACPVV